MTAVTSARSFTPELANFKVGKLESVVNAQSLGTEYIMAVEAIELFLIGLFSLSKLSHTTLQRHSPKHLLFGIGLLV